MDVVEQVDRLTVRVAADHHVLHAVHHTGKLEHRRLSGGGLTRYQGTVRDHVASVSHDEHVADVGLSEPGGQHPAVDAGDEDRGGHRVVSNLLELLYHVPLLAHPGKKNVELIAIFSLPTPVLHNSLKKLGDSKARPRHCVCFGLALTLGADLIRLVVIFMSFITWLPCLKGYKGRD